MLTLWAEATGRHRAAGHYLTAVGGGDRVPDRGNAARVNSGCAFEFETARP